MRMWPCFVMSKTAWPFLCIKGADLDDAAPWTQNGSPCLFLARCDSLKLFGEDISCISRLAAGPGVVPPACVMVRRKLGFGKHVNEHICPCFWYFLWVCTCKERKVPSNQMECHAWLLQDLPTCWGQRFFFLHRATRNFQHNDLRSSEKWNWRRYQLAHVYLWHLVQPTTVVNGLPALLYIAAFPLLWLLHVKT